MKNVFSLFVFLFFTQSAFSQIIFTSIPPDKFERVGDSVIIKRWTSLTPRHVVILAGKDSTMEKFYHQNGILCVTGWQVRFKKGQDFVQSGKWSFYRETGELYEEKIYEKGKLRKMNFFLGKEYGTTFYRRIKEDKWDYHLKRIIVYDSTGYLKRKMIFRPSYIKKGFAFAVDFVAPPWWGNKRSGKEKIKEITYNKDGNKIKKMRWFCGFKTKEKEWFDNGKQKSNLKCRRGDDKKLQRYYENGKKKLFERYNIDGEEKKRKTWYSNGKKESLMKQNDKYVKKEIKYDSTGTRISYVKRKSKYSEVSIDYNKKTGNKEYYERQGMVLRPDKIKEWYPNGKKMSVKIYKQRKKKTYIISKTWDENGKKTVTRGYWKPGRPGPKF